MSENERNEGVLEGVDERGIRKQIVLPWSRALQMTRENIFVRLGRSAITASGIFLGIARERTGSLFVPFSIHALINLVALMENYVYAEFLL